MENNPHALLRAVLARFRKVAPQSSNTSDLRLNKFKEVVCKLKDVEEHRRDEREEVVSRIRSVTSRLRKLALQGFNRERPVLEVFSAALKPTGGGIPLAALSVSERGTSEVNYTQLIRYFLDPKSPHGLGAIVLQKIIESGRQESRISIPVLDFEMAEVDAEVSLGTVILGSRRRKHYHPCIDLVVSFPNFTILIEQKINSDESVADVDSMPESGEIPEDQTALIIEGNPTQLEVYWLAAKHNWRMIRPNSPQIQEGNSLRIFLTPTGKRGKRGNDDWRSLSHATLVERCLDVFDKSQERLNPHCSQVLSQRARYNLLCFLWDLTQGPVMRDSDLLKKLEKRIDVVVSDPVSYFSLKRWCKAEQIEWQVLIKLMEVEYAQTNE